jgi:hypothetical protein
VSHGGKLPKGSPLVPFREGWANIGKAAGVVGVIAFFAGMFGGVERARFGAAYLTGFLFTTTICIGALFFVIIQHLTKAGWSVGPRRIQEWVSQGLVASVLLFIPVLVMSHDIFHHWMGEHAAHDPIIAKKVAYLNPTFFYVRAGVFLLTWAGLATWFYKLSKDQDLSGDRALSEKRQAMAAPATAALGITTSFAGFDWVMSLDPHWYSTIFGVYIFAGALVSSTALLALLVVRFRKDNVGGGLLTVEHQHDVGKFLFGFTVFWAYIGFSQFILIYYANIPEETIWYKHRWEGGWSTLSFVLLFGHFIVPFALLLARTAKRSTTWLPIGAGLLLFMHWIDLYWLVMPNFDHHFHMQWVDFAGLIAPVGITMAWLSVRVLNDAAYPTNDPYIPEALKAENL